MRKHSHTTFISYSFLVSLHDRRPAVAAWAQATGDCLIERQGYFAFPQRCAPLLMIALARFGSVDGDRGRLLDGNVPLPTPRYCEKQQQGH